MNAAQLTQEVGQLKKDVEELQKITKLLQEHLASVEATLEELINPPEEEHKVFDATKGIDTSASTSAVIPADSYHQTTTDRLSPSDVGVPTPAEPKPITLKLFCPQCGDQEALEVNVTSKGSFEGERVCKECNWTLKVTLAKHLPTEGTITIGIGA